MYPSIRPSTQIRRSLPSGSASQCVAVLLQSDQFRFPALILPRTYAFAALCVLVAGVASAMVVRRRIDRLDMVAVLKTRE